jgi:hypothetical protein
MPPESNPIKGMTRPSMNEADNLVNAAPMTKATDMSMRFPLRANSLNSLNITVRGWNGLTVKQLRRTDAKHIFPRINLELGRPRACGDAPPMIPRSSQALRRLLDDVGPVDAVGIEERVAKYTTRSIKKSSKLFGLRLAVSMVDLTTLEGKDTPGKVASLCQKALRPHNAPDIPQVAAVCVYPAMVKHAAKHVKGTPVRIASVATAFPSGQAPLKTRLAEVRQAVADGADEIDMVINRGAFLAGELSLVQDEISSPSSKPAATAPSR